MDGLTIGLGILLPFHLLLGRIARLKVYTVSEMLDLRYGGRAGRASPVSSCGRYTLMLAVTSTIAYATIFAALFDMGKIRAIILGGAIVVIYSTLGGMWSITLTDMVQFVVKTVGIFFLLLPIAVIKAGGFGETEGEAAHRALRSPRIGGETIFTYVLIYTFGMLIGQDIWQRVFTARSRPASPAGRVPSPVRTACSTRSPEPSSARRPRCCYPKLAAARRRLRDHRQGRTARGAARAGARRRARGGDVDLQRCADRLRHRRSTTTSGRAAGRVAGGATSTTR